MIVPYITAAAIASHKYPKLWVLAGAIGLAGTVSEVDRADRWLRKKGFVSAERRLFSEYVGDMSLKSIGVILALGAIVGFISLAFVGITKIYAIIGVAFIAVPLLGTLMYLFRMDHRLGYGVSELCFAAILAGFTIEQSFNSWKINIAEFFTGPNLVARLLALSSSVYIVVRGWDNIGEHRVRKLRSLGGQQLGTAWTSLFARVRRR